MEWTLRELRYFVTAADSGSFTEAAAQLYVSQAAVSRTIGALETTVGERILRRVPRGCELTATGQQILPHARRVLAEAESFTEFLTSRHGVLRLGYAWAAVGRHTARLQREWAQRHGELELQLLRRNSPTAGLAEGSCDVAIVRKPLDEKRFDSVVVGLERRLAAFASDDAQWSRRRQLSMAEVAERTVVIDPRVGTTGSHLWRDRDHQPRFIEASDVDTWLDAIAAARGVGTTADATAFHHPRPGVTYRPIKDGPRIAVRLAWWHDHRPHGLDELVDLVTPSLCLRMTQPRNSDDRQPVLCEDPAMPSTVIEVRRRYDAEHEVALIDAVHDALVSAFRIPLRDKHIRLVSHEPHRFACPPTLTQPELYTLVAVDCFAGRSVEAKRNLYREIAERLSVLGVPSDHLTIILRESALENWGVRGGKAACDVDLGFTINV